MDTQYFTKMAVLHCISELRSTAHESFISQH